MRILLTVLALATASVACGSAAQAEPCEPDGDQMLVDETCVDTWPLTVDEAVLTCEGDEDLAAGMVEADGTTYAMTGWGQQLGGEEMHAGSDVWADDPDNPGTKIPINELRDLAETLC